MTRWGLYGGSFNPIHFGHLIIARCIAEARDLERIIWLPSGDPPHKRAEHLPPAQHLGEMVRQAILGESVFEFSDFDLTRPGPTFTLQTVQHFRKEVGGDVELCWIIGADSLAELPTWYRARELVESCTILTAFRPGWRDLDWAPLVDAFGERNAEHLREGLVQTPLIDISATEIRRRVREGKSIRYLVPEPVRTYIQEQGLYRLTGSAEVARRSGGACSPGSAQRG